MTTRIKKTTTISILATTAATLLLGLAACGEEHEASTPQPPEERIVTGGPTGTGDPVDTGLEPPRGNPLSIDGDTVAVIGGRILRLAPGGAIVWESRLEGEVLDLVIADGDLVWTVAREASTDVLYALDPGTGGVVGSVERGVIHEVQVYDGQLAVLARTLDGLAVERIDRRTFEPIDRYERPDSYLLWSEGRILVSMDGGDGYAVLAFDAVGDPLGQSADFAELPHIYRLGEVLVVLGPTAAYSAPNPYDVYGYDGDLTELWHLSEVFNADVDGDHGSILVSRGNADRSAFELSDLDPRSGETTLVISDAAWGFYQPASVDGTRFYVPYGPVSAAPAFVEQTDGELLQVGLTGWLWPELTPVPGYGLVVRPTAGLDSLDYQLTLLTFEGEVGLAVPMQGHAERPLTVEGEQRLLVVDGDEMVRVDVSTGSVTRERI